MTVENGDEIQGELEVNEDLSAEESHNQGNNNQEEQSEEAELTEAAEEALASRDVDLSAFEEENEDASSSIAAVSTKEAEDLKQKIVEGEHKYLRALADLENYKKRAIKERSELLKYQGEKVFLDLLDIADNFDRAFEHADSDPKDFHGGMEMIHKMFHGILQKWQVKGESALTHSFDPNIHHAISKIATEDIDPGTVINELKKAYYYKDRLIRAAEVVVAVKPDKPAEDESVANEPTENTEENTSKE